MSEVSAEVLSENAVRLTCHIKRPPERVYEAWTSPEELAKWFVPEEGTVTTVHEFDVSVNGHYRFTTKTPNSPACTAAGHFIELDRPRRIVMSWGWEEHKLDGVTSRLTLDFEEAEGGTRFTLTHEQLLNAESRDLHAEGWTGCLNSLAAYLSNN